MLQQAEKHGENVIQIHEKQQIFGTISQKYLGDSWELMLVVCQIGSPHRARNVIRT